MNKNIDHCLIYDCETQYMADEVEGKWKNVPGMKLSSCVVYDYDKQEFLFFGPDENEEVCRYFNGKIVIGFNNYNFDSTLLLGPQKKWSSLLCTHVQNDFGTWDEFDLYLEIQRQVLPPLPDGASYSYKQMIDLLKDRKNRGEPGVYNLKNISLNTLNKTKNDKAENGPKYFKEGNFAKLFQYNLQDVILTKELFEFIIERKYIVNGKYDIVKLEDFPF